MKLLRIASLTLVSLSLVLSGCSDDDDDSSAAGAAGSAGSGGSGASAGSGGSSGSGGSAAGSGGSGGSMGGSAGSGGSGATAGTGGSGGSMAANKDIVDTAIAAGSFNTLVAAVQAADLVDTLKSEGPFTVFAPTDEAFAKLPAGTVDNLLLPENKEQLKSILLYHVVSGSVPSSEVVNLSSATTVNGADVSITVENGMVMINDATVTTPDVSCTNGIIHVIDTVLMPPPAAPVDIVDTAVAAGSFNTLVAAVQAADLVDTLKSEGPFTVFAPTDEAFAKLPAGTVDTLLLPENKEQLKSILLYHVVSGNVSSSEVVNLSSATTVNGADVSITVENGMVMINDATVTSADVMCSNGTIHVIDTVLLPPQLTDSQTLPGPGPPC